MRVLKTIGFSALIWAAIFVIISIFVALKATSPYLTYPVGWLITIGLGWYFAKMLKVRGLAAGAITGVIWLVVAFALDYFITTAFTGKGFFNSWDIWVGYGLIVLVPIIYGLRNK